MEVIMHAKDLTADILIRLTGDALLMFYSCAEHFHAQACQGAAMAVSGEPVADLNYLMLNSGDSVALAAFSRYVSWCDERELPFACMVAPDAIGHRLAPDGVSGRSSSGFPGSGRQHSQTTN